MSLKSCSSAEELPELSANHQEEVTTPGSHCRAPRASGWHRLCRRHLPAGSAPKGRAAALTVALLHAASWLLRAAHGLWDLCVGSGLGFGGF